MSLIDVESHDLSSEVVPVGVLRRMGSGGELGFETGLPVVALRDDAYLVVRGECKLRIREACDVLGLYAPAPDLAHAPPHLRHAVGMS